MLQARMTQGDPRLYSVARDVAHNFPFVAREVARRLRDEEWPVLTELCRRNNVTQEELGQACESFCRFVGGVLDKPTETMQDGIVRSGFASVRAEAQAAFMAYLGQVVAGVYWQGLRDAMAGGPQPLDTEALARAGAECLSAMRAAGAYQEVKEGA